MMLIAISGRAGHGKTTVANVIHEIIGENSVVLPVGSSIKKELEDFLNAVGAGEYAPLMYGTQEEKLQLFTIDTEKAKAFCPEWDRFLEIYADIQTTPGVSTINPRILMQWYGTDFRRKQDDNYWLKAWMRMADALIDKGTIVICDDVRFPIELQAVREREGRVVRVERPGFEQNVEHISENALNGETGWDYVISNSGSLEEFKLQIAGQFESLTTLKRKAV